MPAFDYVIYNTDGELAQVKCWNNLGEIYKKGDEVPELDHRYDYIIFTREGYYIRVENCFIESITITKPEYDATVVDIYDKWGEPYSDETRGLTGEPYLWDDETKSEVN